ncbi:MAG: hypothetical protein Q7S68_05790, partial [Deltaproteobacteria bacterium]|nr:hypothetical protein [Deltaproteobacteria bacterium]
MIGVFFFFLLIAITSPLQASTLRLNATSLGQVRENSNSQREIPVSGYFGLQGTNSKQNLSAATNMRFFRDFDRKLDDYDL